MSRDIREMTKGDFVKVGPGQYEEIERVDPPMTLGDRVPRKWTITTKSGKHLSLWEAKSYYKKDDPRP